MRLLLLFFLASCGGGTNFQKRLTPELEPTPPSEKTYIFEPSFTQSQFQRSEIAFILDNSQSMIDEIEITKLALRNLTEIMIRSGLGFTLKFYKMSKINTNQVLDQQASTNKKKYYDNDLPKPFGTVAINRNSDPSQTRRQIEVALGSFKTDSSFTKEEGLCLTLHHLNALKNSRLDKHTRHMTVLISDEDEAQGNNSSDCYFRMMEKTGIIKSKEYYSFKGAGGKERFMEAFQNLHNQIPWDHKKAYGWLGIFYDKRNSLCTPSSAPNNDHGKNYKKLLKLLGDLGVDNGQEDICEDDYTKVFQQKLISDTLQQRQYTYVIPETTDFPLSLVKIISQQPQEDIVIDPSLYSLIQVDGLYSLEFKQTKAVDDLLDQTLSFEIIYRM